MINSLFSEWSLQLWFARLKSCLTTCLSNCWICLSVNFKESFWADWLKHTWLLIITTETLTSSVSFISDWIEATMMWCLTSPNARGTVSGPLRRPLLCLLLAPVLLGHRNPFSMTLPTTGFTEPLFQPVPMDVGNVVSQAILVKTVQSPKLTNQLRLKRLSSDLMINSLIKILRHDISMAVMMMISQKMTWIFQKILMLHKRHYEIQNVI